MTQLDLKSVNYFFGNGSNVTCVVCGHSSSSFNQFLEFHVTNPTALKFGIRPLHLKLAIMKILLQCGEKSEVRKGRCAENEPTRLARKAEIEKELWEKCQVRVNQVRQGSGNSNDGNTARDFFDVPVSVAEILRLPATLVIKISTLITAVSCFLELNPDAVYKVSLSLKNFTNLL